MHEVGFVRPDDPRFVGTVDAVERELKRGRFLFRYVKRRTISAARRPRSSICTFWYIDALIASGARDEARELFENMLACRNHLGLLSEDIDPDDRRAVGQLPADLFAGRPDQLRDAAQQNLGGRRLSDAAGT